MTRLLLALALVASAAGCGKRSSTTPATAPDEKPAATVNEPAVPGDIKLAEATGARAIEKVPDHALYLNVNSKGEVLLNPADQWTDAIGDKVTTLVNPAQLGVFLKRRAAEDRAAGATKAPTPPKGEGRPEDIIATTVEKEDEFDPTKPKPPLRSTIVWRVDARVPFAKTAALVKEAQSAGFTKAQWRVTRPDDEDEGFFAVTLPAPDDDLGLAIPDITAPAATRYVTRVRATDAGKIGDMTFNGIDLKTDLEALSRKLRAAKQKHKDKPAAIVIEIDGKLLHADVVRIIGVCARADYPDAQLVPLDPKLR